MKWKKIAHVKLPDTDYPWLASHLSNPVVVWQQDDCFRVYFSSRDCNNRAYIAYMDIDLLQPHQPIELCKQPLLELGEIGAFDDNGMSLACITATNEQRFLYYLGWNLGANVPFRNAIGLATAKSGTEAFTRYSKGPLLDRDIKDPFSLSYPFVLHDEGIYKMWYGSHKKWGKTTSDMIHVLKYAESTDGIHWDRKNVICLDSNSVDYAFSRPFVMKENGLYKMWYSYRGKAYRIGYAESQDGLHWARKDDEVGIAVSDSGWDSEMIEYPFIFDHKDQRYLLYNGNRYGKDGIGIAVLEEP